MNEMTPITKLTKDLKAAAVTLSEAEVRYLVDSYYLMQENRIRSDAQIRSMSNEPHDVLAWLAEQNRTLEAQIKNALDKYSMSTPVGEWMRSITGIGPVIAAGLLAHIDIEKAPTAGHIWRFAGLDPTSIWEKKKKRPWNAALKVLCWKLGESFVKVHAKEEDVYGKIYSSRKALEIEKNDRGDFAEQAGKILASKNIGKETDAYKAYSAGKLPPAHIHSRAKRYAVKIFLSHLQHKMYVERFGVEPPAPFAIAHLGHAHKIEPPE